MQSQNSQLEIEDFNRIAAHVTSRYGIKMPLSKKSMVESRLYERVVKYNFKTYREYVDFLFSATGKQELRDLKEYISTNETWFFRENEHFKYLTTYLKRKGIPKKVRVWSSACSSGEEAYSIAITLEELKETTFPNLEYKIWCTDISSDILKKASDATYTKKHLDNIKLRQNKYFDLTSPDKPKIIHDLRRNLIFRQFNLIKDTEYNTIVHKFEVIFCRNVLIYFDKDNQEKVIKNLVSKLKPGGLFMIGHTETSIIKRIPELKQVRPALYEKQ